MTRKLSVAVIVWLGALVLCLPVFGVSAYLIFADKQRSESFDNLQTIADLKANQIEAWLAVRAADAKALSQSHEFVDQVAYLRRLRTTESRQRLRSRVTDGRQTK